MRSGPTCLCGHSDHDSDGWDYPQLGRCRTQGCRCRDFRPVLAPPRELALQGWRAYWAEATARGGLPRWAGWVGGGLVSTALYEVLKACARAAWAYVR